MMSILREIAVYWKCRGCGREGVYTQWDMDADPTTINKVVQQKREIDECPYCTDGVEGPPKSPPIPDELAKEMVKVLQDHEGRLVELEKRIGEVELIKKRLQLARIEGKL